MHPLHIRGVGTPFWVSAAKAQQRGVVILCVRSTHIHTWLYIAREKMCTTMHKTATSVSAQFKRLWIDVWCVSCRRCCSNIYVRDERAIYFLYSSHQSRRRKIYTSKNFVSYIAIYYCCFITLYSQGQNRCRQSSDTKSNSLATTASFFSSGLSQNTCR